MKRITGRVDDERGLTLPELLITVVILGIIIAPLSNAMISFIRISDQTTQRLNESHDIQITAAYFAQDVQSIGVRDWTAYPYPVKTSVELAVPAASGLFPCGAAGTPNAVVRFAWDDPTSVSGAPELVTVAYLVRVVDGENQLRRISCRGGNPAPVSDIVMSHNVESATVTQTPGVVTLSLTIRDPKNTGTGVSVELQGQRRQT